VLRTGQSLTIIKGGIRSNVIPSDGSATFNVRVLPNDDVRGIVQAFNHVGDEKQVKFTLDGEPRTSPPVSPVTSALYQAMEASAPQTADEQCRRESRWHWANSRPSVRSVSMRLGHSH
jgi:acetylornithine deacetylase/succinyl-diaminopimelate desuccinylase-like protein